MVHGKKRIPYWIDWRLPGLAGPEYHAVISFGLPIEPEDSQYGEYRVIPLVQAQVLWVILGELRSFDHNRLQGLIQQRGVVGVGSGNHNAQWAALSFHKQAPLAASLAAIRWVGSN